MSDPTRLFDYQPRTRVVFGAGTLERVGELVKEHGGRRALIVSDQGILAAGHVERAKQSIESAGVKAFVYADAVENPTTTQVDEAVVAAKRDEIDFLIGLGGGSSMDTAKGCNFVLTNGGRMQDYWGIGKATKQMLPLIAIPTTGGTGSECQSFALISDPDSHVKMACGDPKAAAKVAILDPELTVTQPRHVTACTGIDAIAHAVETAVTTKRNPLSLMFAREAFRLTQANLPRVLSKPDDIHARGDMLLGAAFAGTAIENSMLGSAHSCANPLTARFDIVHGQAVGMMLPHIVRFNAEDAAARRLYAELTWFAGLADPEMGEDAAVEVLVSRIEALLEAAGMPDTLASCGVDTNAITALASDAAKQWTANFNPREMDEGDFEHVYRAALGRRAPVTG